MARSTDQGRTITKNFKVDDNTCVCCRTSIATSADGLVYVAWRKIFDGNIRETVVARSTDGGMTFSEPVVVGNDRWVYQARPTPSGIVGRRQAGTPLCGVVYRRAPTRRRRSIWPIQTIKGRRFDNSHHHRVPSPTTRNGCRSSWPRDGDLGRTITRAPRDRDEPFTGSWRIL